MEAWNELMQNKAFITDLGEDKETEIEGAPTILGRYAVWRPVPDSDRHQIVEVGFELEPLQTKYSIPDERVCFV